MVLPRAFRALRHRDFALVWSGQTLSRIGDQVYQIVIAWLVLEETGSPIVMGTVLIFTFLPVAIGSLVSGVVVDRTPRVLVMFVADVARAVAVLSIAALAAADRLEIWMVYLLGLLFGLFDAFFQPAYFALVPEIVPADDLPSSNGLASMSFQFGRVVGPALGGLIIAAGGAVTGLVVNGVSFALAALFVLPLLAKARRPERPEGAAGEQHWLADLREGLATVRRHRIIALGIVVGPLVAACLVGPFLVAMPFLISERFGNDPRIYGALLAVFPVGFILGSLWGGRQLRLGRRGLWIFGGMAVAGVALMLYGLPVALAVLVVAALVNGFCLELSGMAGMLVTQELVPVEQLGRVASLEQLVSWVTIAAAFGVAGWAADLFGPATVFLLGAGAAGGLALLPLAVPGIWRFD